MRSVRSDILAGLVVTAIAGVVGLTWGHFFSEKVEIRGDSQVKSQEKIQYELKNPFGDPNHFNWILLNKKRDTLKKETGKVFEHTFEQIGNYVLELRYTRSNNNLTDDFDDLEIEVKHAIPKAIFSIENPCLVGEPIKITNNSRFASKYSWVFSGNVTSNEKVPTIAYNERGKYRITLIVENPDGLKSEFFQHVIVEEPLEVKDSTHLEKSTVGIDEGELADEVDKNALNNIIQSTSNGITVSVGAKEKLLKYLIERGANSQETLVYFDEETYHLEEFVRQAGFIDFSKLEVTHIGKSDKLITGLHIVQN